MTTAFTLPLMDCQDALVVGGKAINLCRLMRGGFNVPDGFVVTTAAYRAARAATMAPTALPPEVAQEIRAAYRAMGGGAVAVRSSATAEDMAGASMAGQYETVLDVEGEEAVIAAVMHCWASLGSPRVIAYLKEHDIDLARVAMAVIVQRLAAADVAGVLFTANPQNDRRREMLLEASWGLGESVVSGRVQPDVLRIDERSGQVVAAIIADKEIYLAAGAGRQCAVEESRRNQPCLRGRDVHRLWRLGRRIADHFDGPQDIEWAMCGEELYVLQSRPITTGGQAHVFEEVLRGTRRHLRQEVAKHRGPWALHNLGETLPHPTPLTWSIIAKFMSGSGGFGEMYRQAGFAPAPGVSQEGFLELIGGRIYMDAGRAPEMFFERFPFAYDLDALKSNPEASQGPPTVPRGGFLARMKALRQLGDARRKLTALSADYDRQLRDVFFPAMERYVAEGWQMDLRALDAAALIDLWQAREAYVMQTFGPQSLMPSLICGMVLAGLRDFAAEHFWQEEPDALAQFISSGGPANRTIMANAELYEVANGQRTLEVWLADHGHRAAGEFDLASPRWREQPQAARAMAERLRGGENPLDRHRQHAAEVNGRLEQLRAALPARARRTLDGHVDLVRRYVVFREDGKDFLMLGYNLLRDVALEAGRRLETGADVFYLTKNELFEALKVGFAPFQLIEERKAAYLAEERLELPRVIDKDNVETLGDVAEVAPPGGGYEGLGVSGGLASGPACILRSLADGRQLGTGYILVCPSTDPAWTPLFVNAAGLVLERGGALSHGAVVAREMGIPAVVLADATRTFAEGEQICVDGNSGRVGPAVQMLAGPVVNEGGAGDPEDTHVLHELIPPVPGPKDRRAAKIRNIAAIFWIIYLVGVFFLPRAWIEEPSLRVMDRLFWPLVAWLGRPLGVVVIAGGIAAVMLLIQRFGTDNARLREAKRRAAGLRKEAAGLAKDSPRRAALNRLAAPIPLRLTMAAMLPVGVLLGPLVLPFMWFSQRVDPGVWNAQAGSAVQVVAMVKGDAGGVHIRVPAGLALDETTPAQRTLEPIKSTLERLLRLYRSPEAGVTREQGAWEFEVVPDVARERMADDLQAFLEGGIPAQGVMWRVRTEAGAGGRFEVAVGVEGEREVKAEVVVGEEFLPGAKVVKGAGGGVEEVRVVYAKPKEKQVFFRPLAFMAGWKNVPWAGWLAAVDMGWVGVYVLAYLPVLLGLKALLGVA